MPCREDWVSLHCYKPGARCLVEKTGFHFTATNLEQDAHVEKTGFHFIATNLEQDAHVEMTVFS